MQALNFTSVSLREKKCTVIEIKKEKFQSKAKGILLYILELKHDEVMVEKYRQMLKIYN